MAVLWHHLLDNQKAIVLNLVLIDNMMDRLGLLLSQVVKSIDAKKDGE